MSANNFWVGHILARKKTDPPSFNFMLGMHLHLISIIGGGGGIPKPYTPNSEGGGGGWYP